MIEYFCNLIKIIRTGIEYIKLKNIEIRDCRKSLVYILLLPEEKLFGQT